MLQYILRHRNLSFEDTPEQVHQPALEFELTGVLFLPLSILIDTYTQRRDLTHWAGSRVKRVTPTSNPARASLQIPENQSPEKSNSQTYTS